MTVSQLIRHAAFASTGLLLAVASVQAQDPRPQTAGWSHYGGDAGGSRFSPAQDITADTVGDLEMAWEYSTGDMETRPEAVAKSASEGTPILVNGRLTYCTPFNEIIALDPGTGDKLWRYDPGIATDYEPANQYVCRGVVHWEDTQAEPGAACAARIFMGTADSRVIAVDAATGDPCAQFGETGQVKINPGMDLWWPGEFQITSPPVTVGDVACSSWFTFKCIHGINTRPRITVSLISVFEF